VAKIIPRLGKATAEKIAINAVMAGALPVHMPVLIAAVQALMDQKTRFDTFEVSTGSWAPFFAINGPIRHDIHINYSSGSLSPGNIANSAGGPGAWMGLLRSVGGIQNSFATKKIELPRDWDKLVEKYKDVIPVYAGY